MTKRIRHPFEKPELSRRQVNRHIEPLLRRFQEELTVKMKEATAMGNLPFRYDVKNDMLHLFVASSENTISSPGHKGIYIDYDQLTHRIVGMTILGFQSTVLPDLEGVDHVQKAWRKNRWKMRLLTWVEWFAGLFGITIEDLRKKHSKDAVETWVDWLEENPTKLELMPVATV